MHDDDCVSNFAFSTDEDSQVFHHQWYAQGKLHDCPTCYSRITADEPPSQHWLRDGKKTGQLQLTRQQQAVLDIIESRQIETFFFCDESAKDKLEHFIGETCTQSVPELLRWMFHNRTLRIEFNVACYVNIINQDQVLIFQSGTLGVEHHYDVDECVTVIYELLMERIQNYLSCSYDVDLENCSITRIRVQVKRVQRNASEDGELNASSQLMALPLQLHHQSACRSSSNSSSEEELSSLHAAYVKCERECHGYFPPNMRVNLYGIQQCQTTKELFVVPYHISETLQKLPNKNFLILNDVMGQFQRLHRLDAPLIATPTPRSTKLECRRCRTHFKRRSRLLIHQQLRCGQDFSVDSMHADIVEVYEQCLPISRSVFQYACYGITKPKTIMRKGQFVPIECDWRSESSVKVQHGPCVVISSAYNSSPCKYC
ncbi:protein terminus-like [Scaptodrosophila lebanonensis]|uniref:Protein terminus-like n=1 Tax=Drosophila lebanonensis TaxID=7225 RepID=A0A6J2T7V9_DROLE|nr:protein terminus-like [Scaptodrosophila lebanonensis]